MKSQNVFGTQPTTRWEFNEKGKVRENKSMAELLVPKKEAENVVESASVDPTPEVEECDASECCGKPDECESGFFTNVVSSASLEEAVVKLDVLRMAVADFAEGDITLEELQEVAEWTSV